MSLDQRTLLLPHSSPSADARGGGGRGGGGLDLAGGSGVLRLSQINGAPVGSAADDPITLATGELGSGIIAATIPSAITTLLPNGPIAMAVVMTLPDGRSGITMVAGVWTVSEGYTD